jgi:hypothetical protein
VTSPCVRSAPRPPPGLTPRDRHSSPFRPRLTAGARRRRARTRTRPQSRRCSHAWTPRLICRASSRRTSCLCLRLLIARPASPRRMGYAPRPCPCPRRPGTTTWALSYAAGPRTSRRHLRSCGPNPRRTSIGALSRCPRGWRRRWRRWRTTARRRRRRTPCTTCAAPPARRAPRLCRCRDRAAPSYVRLRCALAVAGTPTTLTVGSPHTQRERERERDRALIVNQCCSSSTRTSSQGHLGWTRASTC